jgi:ketosteroid isomerase-like protein
MGSGEMDAVEVVRAYAAAWNVPDADACGALFTDDGVREWMVRPLSPNIPARYEGRASVTEGIRGFMVALPDIRVDMLNTWEVPGGAVGEWRVTGTHTVDWDLWDAQGEAVQFTGTSIYRIRDGRIAEERLHFDTGLMSANWKPPTG